MNPADRHEEDHLVSQEPIMTKIDQFFRSKAPFHHGNNQMIILADAGMGKSALLTMLKLLHITSFWPNDKECALKKLGPRTLREIQQIENKSETILLLDSLDEDSSAYGRVGERLIEILRATQNFYRVVITCRTQFFPNTQAEPLERPGLIQISGFICPTKYLSFFDDKKVELYLKKRFPNKLWILPQKKLREEAKRLINKMGPLRSRPMLLSYIEDLMASPKVQGDTSEYVIYKALIENWLLREEAKTKVPAKELFRACELLATESTVLAIQQKRSISEAELDRLIAGLPAIGHIKDIDVKGRSLLNRNSDGDYRFSHYSFQEFLIAHRIIQDKDWRPKNPVHSSELILQFIYQGRDLMVQLRLNALDFTGANLKQMNFFNVDLRGANFAGANLSEANLMGANLAKAHLSKANLKGADLLRANLYKADLSFADLTDAKLIESDLSHADLRFATLAKADLSRAKLASAWLRTAHLWDACLKGANLEKAKLWGADLRNTNLEGANLSESDFSNTILCGAKLNNAQLRGVNINGANISNTLLKDAKFDSPAL
jgi:uncharacterized protein YjbI with pentapeptide repeats